MDCFIIAHADVVANDLMALTLCECRVAQKSKLYTLVDISTK